MIDVEKALEFCKIKEKWMELALTERAKQEIQNVHPYKREVELIAKLRETTEAKILIEKTGNPPLVSLNGLEEMVEIAEKGGCLNPEQLESVGDALTAVKRLSDYLNRGKGYEVSLAYYDETLNALEDIRDAIHLQIRGGKVDDYASKLLKSLRTEIEQTETKMREKADSVMRANKNCMSDNFSTMRNGHVCIPVKKEFKAKIQGAVLDKSSTGNTLFIEPVAAARYFEELQYLKLDEENEERRILYTLTAMISDEAESLKQDIRMIEKLDFMFSKAKLSLEYDGTEPKMNTDRVIRLKNGRHPLMEKKTSVPLQFQIGNTVNDSIVRGVVITGPNTGGKTVAIKTVALNCMMAQCGLHVACEDADICMNSEFLCDIGDGQNLSENLSTFSAHIHNVLDILKRVDKDSLVIMDELGSGTDPTEGMGIAIAILEKLKESGALFLVTTHYPEVKEYAQKETGIVNARMTFDKESLKPLYQFVIGEAGESCAFYIAQKLGMPDSMLRRAVKEAYGEYVPAGLVLSGKNEELKKEHTEKIQKKKIKQSVKQFEYQLGDSVMVYPDKKIGIVCQKINEKGVMRVQMAEGKKIWINHKRVKLLVSTSELYPENYDFSIVFDSVETRKLRHQMDRKYVEGKEAKIEE